MDQYKIDNSLIIVTIANQRGLHARASAKFVKCAENFDAEIKVSCKDVSVPGTSIMGLMMLGACKGTPIQIQAIGPDQEKALSALKELVEDKFGEDRNEEATN